MSKLSNFDSKSVICHQFSKKKTFKTEDKAFFQTLLIDKKYQGPRKNVTLVGAGVVISSQGIKLLLVQYYMLFF
jgi:hypothetical protein